MEGLIVLAFCMAALGVPMRTFLPVFAEKIFHRGAGTYATFLSVSGCGSVVGALAVAGLGNVRRTRAGWRWSCSSAWDRRCGLCALPFAASELRHAVLRRRRHDGRSSPW